MKMRFTGSLAFALLLISVLSYGANTSAFAEQHLPLFVETELPTYGNGDEVVFSGSIRNYASDSGLEITFIIKSPTNNLVTIGQITPNSDGTFEHTFTAGGPLWKSSGDYVVELHFGTVKGDATIVYTGGDAPEPTEPEPVEPEPTEPEPTEPEPVEPDLTCGAGTELVNGICQVIKTDETEKEKEDQCLIATASYGSELAPQVQMLREIRDNYLLETNSGAVFMGGFNAIYYSFAPTVAQWENENPVFKEIVRIAITPLISSLSLLNYVDMDSEAEVLGYGISLILLNIGMYFVAPVIVLVGIRKRF